MPDSKHLIVGLGNPGPEYANTRHNVGFMVADALAERLDVQLQAAGPARIGWGAHDGADVGVAKPQTYMNRSGTAVAAMLEHYDVPVERLLVVVDDLNLDTGQIRLRPGGSSGGHNGLSDIADRLGTTDYPRLRIGIGNDFPSGGQVDYVLAPFSAQQRPVVDDALIDACNAALAFVNDGVETAMNRFNG
jgi:PTH1 family peptidyl-tRNA hydrolase